MRELTEYRTPSGRTCTTRGGRPPLIRIDGEEATVERHEVLRDGGTEVYVTDCGTLIFPRRLGISDRTPRLDGEPLTVDGREPWQWRERRQMERETRRMMEERERGPAPVVKREPVVIPERRFAPSPPLFARSGPHDPAQSMKIRDELLAAQAKHDAWSPERELENRPPLTAWAHSTDREVYAHLSDEQYRRLCEYRDGLSDRR